MKKLLYLNQAMGMGGAEVFMADLLEALQKKGWVVAVVTTRQEFVDYLQDHHLLVKQVPFIMDLIGNWKGLVKAVIFGPLALLQWLFILVQHLDQASHTTVLVSGFNGKLLVTGIAKLLGFKVVWIQFSGLGSILDRWGGWVGAWFKWSIRQVDGVITSSEHSKKVIMAELPVMEKKIQVIACGRKIPVARYKQVQQKNIVCVSRLQPGKGQDLLLKAMPAILQKHPDAHLQIVGQGDFESELKTLITELNLQKQVTLTGKVTSTQTMLDKAMISVFPSIWKLEGFGLVLIEAMAAAKPIVSFDRGPINEIIDHGKNGLLAKSGLVEDLARKICTLFDDEKLRKKLAKQAVKDFQEQYTIEQVAKIYDQHLSNHHR